MNVLAFQSHYFFTPFTDVYYANVHLCPCLCVCWGVFRWGGGGQTVACVSPLCILPRLWVDLWKSAWRSSSQWPERSQSRRTQTEVLREPQIPASSETSNPLFSCPNSKAIKLSWQPFRKQRCKPHPDPPPPPHHSCHDPPPPSYTSTRDIRDLPRHFLNKDLTS